MSAAETERNHSWVTLLKSDSVDSQLDALRQIGHQERVVGLAIPVAVLSGSRDDEVRMWAAEVLETVIQPEPDDVPELVALLEVTTDGEVGYWVATLLGRLGDLASPAVDALATWLDASDFLAARERATWALGQIGFAAWIALPTLQNAAENGPPRLSRLARQSIRSILAKIDQQQHNQRGDVAA